MSKPVSISIPHQLGQAEARRRIEQGLHELQGQIAGKGMEPVRQSWAGDVLSFSARVLGQSVSGRIKVLDDAVDMDIDLPGFLAVIANTVKGRLQSTGRLLLDKK